MEKIDVRTTSRTELREITREVAAVVSRSGILGGVCLVFVPHTTAGVTINENADPAARHDIETIMDGLVPWNGPYLHSEGNSAAHVKATLVGFSVLIPVDSGRLVLGTWQGVYFCEFDGPRSRKVHIQVLAG